MMIVRATLLVIIVQVMIYYGTGAESRKLQQSKTQFSAMNKLNEPKYLPQFSENVQDVSDSSNATEEELNSVSLNFNDDKNDSRYKREIFNTRTDRYTLPNINTDIRYILPPNTILFNNTGIDHNDDKDEDYNEEDDDSSGNDDNSSGNDDNTKPEIDERLRHKASVIKMLLKATIQQINALLAISEKFSEYFDK
ncbi:S-cell enriched with leucine-rich repeat-containing protein slrA-like isoform X1 [Centruroides sculpturatus]|uniref:S-cell enriched with leucine-rich repeat-containing protein slrA-like isoform X1 n=1 Tax=Centruroides sculpturatus TaxID=218467 RepID=UPI000C6EF123|nr:S-cell enriched with leucine-rich repeat-containing protein slrA-like isoform X1 [Centruroides sculpturatus]